MNIRIRKSLLAIARALDQAAQAIRRFVKARTPKRAKAAEQPIETTAAA